MTERNASQPGEIALDAELGRFVVEKGLATPEEVSRCETLLSSMRGPTPLGAVLVSQEVLTAGQVDRARKALAAAGGQIPGYRVICRLGSGAMASVFKARQISLDRIVAVKVLSRRLSENPEYVDRFVREGQAAAKLNHPNIVQAIDVGEANNYRYFVMEYVEGHTLYDELATGKVFSEPEALDVMLQIARALTHAHAQGFIHRDVKPKNIMITPQRVAKLADMGLARLASDYETAQAEAGRAFGTPYYISPEQIRGQVDVDFRSDIYSLGATLYHLVTGRVPFEAPTPAGVMYKHLPERLIPPDHVNGNLSSGLGEVVEAMMAKDPEKRYASTADLMVDLDAVAVGEPPPQARQRIDAGLLRGLTDESSAALANEETQVFLTRTDLTPYVILLAALLALSLIVNMILLMAR